MNLSPKLQVQVTREVLGDGRHNRGVSGEVSESCLLNPMSTGT